MEKFFKYSIFFITLLASAHNIGAQTIGNRISGRILDARTSEGIYGATVMLEGTYLWATSGKDGRFSVSGVSPGDQTIHVSYLGYRPTSLKLPVQGDMGGLDIRLTENSLAIEEVVVTAQSKNDELTTAYTIGSDALRHMQVNNISDVQALLPGGKMVNPDLSSDNSFRLRDGGSSAGNVLFGTAVEVDGVRLGNNASFGNVNSSNYLTGVSTRNITVENIDYIEVITGVPSVEYGDMNSGMVRIHTRTGHTPWNVVGSVNPRTQSVSLSKGFDLGDKRGFLNVSAEWTRATRNLVSPYQSYTRRGFSTKYSNTYRSKLKFDLGFTGNIGGMNSKDDPDAYSGEYSKVRDNVLRANTSLTWLVNKPWVTNLRFEAYVNYNDNRSHNRTYHSSASEQPGVHATEEGYFIADKLPFTYFADKISDSKELDYSASLKYEWNLNRGGLRNRIKAGVQWKANGNAGKGEYYLDPALAATGYRPRPYKDYPYLHNISVYAEENITFPVAGTRIEATAGIRYERVSVSGTGYDNLNTFSPRFNARWRLTDFLSVRGGWGITEKLPSYYVLYPEQKYRDVRTFGVTYNNNETTYVYHTQPYTMLHNSNLKWQRNHNSELGINVDYAGFKISLSGYINRTKFPYKYSDTYTPYSYNMLELPGGYSVPSNASIKVDNQTGMVYIRGDQEEYWTPMDVSVTDRTFVKNTSAGNGPDMIRKGVELVVDFPEIKPIRTQFRLDGAYAYTKYLDNTPGWYYNQGWSHSELIPNRSYQFVGLYANGDGSTSTANGRRTNSLDANITAVTHIPRARIIISCRLEMSLLKRTQNLSQYAWGEYAFNVTEDSNTPVGGSIYDGDSYTAIRPISYMDLEGNIHPFTDVEANDPAFANLILKSGNGYVFARDGYKPYFSANLSVTKEIGDHVGLSFFVNNFTNGKLYHTSIANGVSGRVSSIPDFYYGFTCRLKF